MIFANGILKEVSEDFIPESTSFEVYIHKDNSYDFYATHWEVKILVYFDYNINKHYELFLPIKNEILMWIQEHSYEENKNLFKLSVIPPDTKFTNFGTPKRYTFAINSNFLKNKSKVENLLINCLNKMKIIMQSENLTDFGFFENILSYNEFIFK